MNREFIFAESSVYAWKTICMLRKTGQSCSRRKAPRWRCPLGSWKARLIAAGAASAFKFELQFPENEKILKRRGHGERPQKTQRLRPRLKSSAFRTGLLHISVPC